MQNKTNFTADFYDEGIFHVYNRTNNKELLFKSRENRLYFLRQYHKYLHPFVDTFCWNLLPNHFHFLLRIKMNEAIKIYLQTLAWQTLKPIERRFLADTATTELLMELQWKRFFNSYAMAFNKQHQRHGNLFQRPFKRVEVIKESHFTEAIIYIHRNARHHNLCKDFTSHEWSSWHTMLSDNPTLLKREEVLECFGGKQRFIDVHKSRSDNDKCDVAIEDDD